MESQMAAEQPAPNKVTAKTPSSFVQREFCPHGGIHSDSGNTSAQFNQLVHGVLRDRLRAASIILCGGFLAFLIRGFFVSEEYNVTGNPAWALLGPHIAVTILLGLIATKLCYRCTATLRALRISELIIFGIPALFFAWMQTYRACDGCSEIITQPLQYAAAYPAVTALPWMLHIYIYGLFIPNTWKRALIVVASFAMFPLLSSLYVGLVEQSEGSKYIARELFERGGFSAMFLWLAIACAAAVYGTHRFGALRREAFEARRLGVYTLREKLGAGGMGEVYLAEHHLLKRPCAIKLIQPEKAGDPTTIVRFEEEVQATARLTHPNTVEIFDYGHTDDGTFYYAMEFLPGLSLQELVDRFGPLPPERVVHLLSQVCGALKEAHGIGLIHRDIKPGNIFAAERGGMYDVAKLLDFGLVKSITDDDDEEDLRLTRVGAIVGSPLYAAPESTLEGELGTQSDIYSLGATAYFLLTGKPLFQHEKPLKVIFAHANEMPRPLTEIDASIPDSLNHLVMKCLEKEPEKRFAEIDALADALEECKSSLANWTNRHARDWWLHSDFESRSEPSSELDETAQTISMVANR